jgi:hypothetical protein
MTGLLPLPIVRLKYNISEKALFGIIRHNNTQSWPRAGMCMCPRMKAIRTSRLRRPIPRSSVPKRRKLQPGSIRNFSRCRSFFSGGRQVFRRPLFSGGNGSGPYCPQYWPDPSAPPTLAMTSTLVLAEYISTWNCPCNLFPEFLGAVPALQKRQL